MSLVSSALRQVGGGTKERPAKVCGRLISPPPKDGECGPLSLMYCLMKWNVDAPLRKLVKYTNCTRNGTTGAELIKGVKRFGVVGKQVEAHTSKRARSVIDGTLRKGGTLVLGVDGDDHWVACISKTRRGYLVFDPYKKGPVIQLLSWRALDKRMAFVHKRTKEKTYEFVQLFQGVRALKQ